MSSNTVPKYPSSNHGIDFSSKDYLRFSTSETIHLQTQQMVSEFDFQKNSIANIDTDLLTNRVLTKICNFHKANAALFFSTAKMAVSSLFGAVNKTNTIVFYDELCSSFITEGLASAQITSEPFTHNDYEDLEYKIVKSKLNYTSIFLVTEAVFDLDGDTPQLEILVSLSEKYQCKLIIDESNAVGVFGERGQGLLYDQEITTNVMARIINFNSGFGCSGAAILGSNESINGLRDLGATNDKLAFYFMCRLLITYQNLENSNEEVARLRENINYFNQVKQLLGIRQLFVRSKSALQSAVIPGKANVESIAAKLHDAGFDVKTVVFPDVPEGQERLQICLHCDHSKAAIDDVLQRLILYLF